MVTELGLADTNGILSLPWIDPVRNSAAWGRERLYVSTQRNCLTGRASARPGRIS